MTTRATIAATTLRSIAADERRTPKATIAAILASATMAGETAAEVEYDALTPETARALLRRAGSDVVPDYADEAAREIVRASCARKSTRRRRPSTAWRFTRWSKGWSARRAWNGTSTALR